MLNVVSDLIWARRFTLQPGKERRQSTIGRSPKVQQMFRTGLFLFVLICISKLYARTERGIVQIMGAKPFCARGER